jgi:hypothetical protein
LLTTDFLALLDNLIDSYRLLISGKLNGGQVLVEMALDEVDKLMASENVEMDLGAINTLPRVYEFIHEFYWEKYKH